jgi:hypothetical protein
MKKALLFGFILLCKIAYAQTITVAGTVTDPKGAPIPFAFVSDSQHPYATYTDINGSFSLNADASSNLIASAVYHSEVKTKIADPGNVKIVLPLDAGKQQDLVAEKGNSFFKPDESRIDHVESINHIGIGDQTLHGSRYLYENWVHGFAVTPKDSIKQNDSYLFNYDKVRGNLIFTRNKNSAMLVEKGEIKGFTLFDDNAVPASFEMVPTIDDKRYVEVLSAGPKYKIYRTLSTKFIKADFTTNGFTSTGHTYDEYKDESIYYVIKGTGQPQKFELRSKALKAAFADESESLKKFLSNNKGDIDKNYIKALGDYINQ